MKNPECLFPVEPKKCEEKPIQNAQATPGTSQGDKVVKMSPEIEESKCALCGEAIGKSDLNQRCSTKDCKAVCCASCVKNLEIQNRVFTCPACSSKFTLPSPLLYMLRTTLNAHHASSAGEHQPPVQKSTPQNGIIFFPLSFCYKTQLLQ